MKKIIFVNFSAIAGILSMMLLVSCGGGGGSTSSGGGTASGAMVQGNVSQFNGVAMMAPGTEQSRLASVLKSLSDGVLTDAIATAGVSVTIGGVTTVTSSDGSFSVEGVPPGPTDVVLTYQGVTATINIVIPDNAEEVYLNDVQVVGDNIVIGAINIEIDDGTSSDSTVASDDKSSDDVSSDDKSSVDDVSSDDNSSAATTT